MVLELSGQVKAKLPIEEQLIITDRQRIASRQARNRFTQALGRHSDSIDRRQQSRKGLCLLKGVIAIEIQTCRWLPIGVRISLHIDRGIMSSCRKGQGIVPLLVCQYTAWLEIIVDPVRCLNTCIRLTINVQQSQPLKHRTSQGQNNDAIAQNSHDASHSSISATLKSPFVAH